jgi:hypothetical protein
MAVLFTKVLQDAALNNNPKYGDVTLRDFLRDKALQASSKNTKPSRIVNSRKAVTSSKPMPGRMTCFFYDAKHKDTLPYWDKFPMIFPLEFYDDGMLGINLHYLPPIFRARLMDALYDLLNNQKYDETSKLRLSYSLLNKASKYKYFKPCIKRYLYSHVRSQFVTIDIREWDYALMLPLARFQKAKQRKVWDDSIKMATKS